MRVVIDPTAKGCGYATFPPRADCYQCLSSDMEWFEVTGAGKLLSFTKLEYAPSGFEEDIPYTLALVDYGAYKVFGRLSRNIPKERSYTSRCLTELSLPVARAVW